VPLNLSFTHLVVVLVVALVVLGPDRLPEAARTMGKWLSELRRMSSGLQAEVHETFGEFAEPFSDLVQTVRGGAAGLAATVTSAVVEAPANDQPDAPIVVPPLGGTASPSPASPSPASPSAGSPSAASPGPAQQAPVPSLSSLPALGPTSPAPGTFCPGPAASGPVFAPLGTPEPGVFSPRP
jgi:sec-independent protein translocase protein TatB